MNGQNVCHRSQEKLRKCSIGCADEDLCMAGLTRYGITYGDRRRFLEDSSGQKSMEEASNDTDKSQLSDDPRFIMRTYKSTRYRLNYMSPPSIRNLCNTKRSR